MAMFEVYTSNRNHNKIAKYAHPYIFVNKYSPGKIVYNLRNLTPFCIHLLHYAKALKQETPIYTCAFSSEIV